MKHESMSEEDRGLEEHQGGEEEVFWPCHLC
jgi:hypothetical protein